MARDRPGTSSQKKRRTKKRREEKWEATAVTTLLKAAQTPRTCGSLFAGDILSRKYRLRPSYHRGEGSLQVLTSSTTIVPCGASRRQLKGHPWRPIIWPRKQQGWHSGVGGGEAESGKQIPQPVIPGMHNQDSEAHTLVPRLPVLSRAPMILNYAGIAERSVLQSRRYLLDRG